MIYDLIDAYSLRFITVWSILYEIYLTLWILLFGVRLSLFMSVLILRPICLGFVLMFWGYGYYSELSGV